MAALRPIEEFFCNPTFDFTMENEPRTSITSDMSFEEYRRSVIMPPQGMFSFKPGNKTPEPTATIKSFAEDPLFWRGYTSEEEVASPVASDDMSFHSASSDSEQASEVSQQHSFPEQLAQSCNRVEQQCSKAQAVTLVSAGKAKVVSMPKLVDVSPRMKRPAIATTARLPVSRMNRMEINPRNSVLRSRSPRTSSERQPSSTAEYPQRTKSVIQGPSTDQQQERPGNIRQRSALDTDERRKRTRDIQQRPSLPDLQAAARTEPSTPDSLPARPTRLPRTVDFLKYDPYPSQWAAEPTTPISPVSPSRRRLHKISSSFSLNVFGKGIKRSNSADGSPTQDLDTVKEPEPVMVSPQPSDPQPLARAPKARPKMVARGASERAPPLVLPPCPENYEDEVNVTSWPARADSATATAFARPPTTTSKLHKRQRSMSAALVSAQA